MHEVSLVADLVAEAERQADGRPVTVIRIRYASSIPEETLRQAFQMLTEDGPLANARLDAQPFDVLLECPCGFSGALGHDDLISSSIAVCPACGAVHTRPRTAELELLEVRLVGTELLADINPVAVTTIVPKDTPVASGT